MGAKPGNKNATKKGPGRVDVHISVGDTRRAKMERYLREVKQQEPTNENIKAAAKERLYDWIDGLPL